MARTLHSALLLLFPILLLSQNVEFQLYTTVDGLSDNAISRATQDKQGYIWVSCERGLNRFDGQHFLNLDNAGSAVFPKSKIARNFATKADKLYYWHDNQINVFNTATCQETSISIKEHVPHPELKSGTTSSRAPDGTIVTLLMNEELKLFYLARLNDDGIYKVDLLPGFKTLRRNFAIDAAGGIYYFADTNLMKCGYDGKIAAILTLDEDRITPILKMSQQNDLFIVYDGHVSVLRAGATTIVPHPVTRHLKSMNLMDVLETAEGNLWISAQDQHLYFYDAATDRLKDFKPQLEKIFQNNVTLQSIFQDKSGTIWVETKLGLLKVVPRQSLFHTFYTDKYDVCSFRGFTEDNSGAVYAGFYNNI